MASDPIARSLTTCLRHYSIGTMAVVTCGVAVFIVSQALGNDSPPLWVDWSYGGIVRKYKDCKCSRELTVSSRRMQYCIFLFLCVHSNDGVPYNQTRGKALRYILCPGRVRMVGSFDPTRWNVGLSINFLSHVRH